MAGGRTLGILGGLVAVAVAVGIWMALGTDGAPTGDDGAGGADPGAAPADAHPAAAAPKAPRQRAKSAGTASVTGVVKRRTGAAPVAGQEVQLLRDGFDPWTATTDADGAFVLGALPDGGPFELRVEAKGFATVRLPGIGLGRGEERDAGTIWLDRAVRLPVSVRDFADVPIAGAAVSAFVAPEYGDDFDWSKAIAQMAVEPVAVATTTTDANGAAVFPELASGNWTITASAPGRARGAARHVGLRGGQEPPEVVIRLAEGHEISGRVLDTEKKPVAGAVVVAGSPNDLWDLGGAAARVRTESDAAGKYTLTGLDAGAVSLSVGRKGAVPSVRATVRVPSVTAYDLVLRATGKITGVVTEKSTSKPVEGATVRAVQWGMSYETAEATTGADGRYTIEAFPAGSVNDLYAEKDGLVRVAAEDNAIYGGGDVRVHDGDTLTKDLVLQSGASVTGTVTSGGAPVAGAKVIVRVGRPNRGVEFTKTATTGADGRWRADGVLPGPGFCEAKKEGYYLDGFPEQWWSILQNADGGEAFRVEVPETGEAKLDLVLTRGASVAGRVEGPDGPVAGATVWAQGAKQGTSADDGTFKLDGVHPGAAVSIGAHKRGLVQAKAATFEVLADGPSPEVVLRLVREPVVRGRVTTADGSPLRDARVVVQPKSDEPRQAWMINSQPVDFRGAEAVHADGTFEAKVPFTEGSFVVHAMDATHGTAESAAVAVAEGRTEYEADVRLGAGGVVRGRVTSGGRGVAGAEVTLTEHADQNAGMMMMSRVVGGGGAVVWAVTGADGSFAAGPLGDGTWDVTAKRTGFVKSDAVKASVPQQGDVVIDLAAALEIAGRVAFADGKPAEGITVRAVGAAADPRQQIFGWDGGGEDEESQQVTTDADGRFRLKGLKAGNYRIHAEPQWMSKVNARPTTSDPVAAGAADVKVTVRAGGVIAGRVVDDARKPVAGAWVNCNQTNPDNEQAYRAAATDSDGRFELTGLGDGNCTLYVQSQSGSHQPVQKPNVPVGTKDVEVVLASGLTIDGVIVKSDGKPVAGIYVQAQRIRGEGDDASNWSGGQSDQTTSEGKFRLGGLGAGHYKLTLNDWSGTGQSFRLVGADDVPAGASGVRLVAAEGLHVAGLVVDETGAPIAGAQVNVAVPNDAYHGAVTDAAGRFDVSGLPEGKVRVFASAAGRAQASSGDVAAGTRDVRIVLPKGLSLSGRVLDAAGKPFQGRILFRSSQDAGGVTQWAQTDADGKFTLEGLREGSWSASAFVSDADKPNSFHSVELGTVEAGSAGVELQFAK